MQPTDNIERLKRCQWLEINSARLLGGWLPGIVRWEHKGAAALHIWQDAQRSQQLRTRLWELRTPAPDRKIVGNPQAIIDALARARENDEFFVGFYLVFKAALALEYRTVLEGTHRVCDAPSLPVLNLALASIESQIDWARPIVAELGDSGEKQRRIRRWSQYIAEVLRSEGLTPPSNVADADGSSTEPPPGYSSTPLPFGEAKRDSRFKLSLEGPPPPAENDTLGATIYQFVNYAHEMQAAETLGSLLWEADDMEWEFYFDVARHCYDEARHSQLGEARLSELGYHISDFPHSVANYAWRQLIDPLRRYCVLTYVIEADSFEYKHRTYKQYIESQDMKSAESVLFDIIDETLHLRWGKKWTPKLMERYGCQQSLDELIHECRAILLKNTINPLQKASAEKAAR